MKNHINKVNEYFKKRRDTVWAKGESYRRSWIEKFESRKKIYDFAIDKDSICVEVGVRLAENACLIYQTGCKELHLVDMWYQSAIRPHHSSNDKFFKTVSKVFKGIENVKIHREKSEIACNKFKNESIDFIYIDAGHTYDDVKKDLESWREKVKIGGYIAGDDYIKKLIKSDKSFPNIRYGVVKAVDEFIENGFAEIVYFDNEKTFPLPGDGQFCLRRIK